MARDKLIKLANIYGGLVKTSGNANRFVAPAIRNSGLAQKLSSILQRILNEAVKEEPFPSGEVAASAIKIEGRNDGRGWTFNCSIIWKKNSLLQDPVVGAEITAQVNSFLATVNAIAKREFDKNLPEAGQISEEIYYNNDASDFIYGGV